MFGTIISSLIGLFSSGASRILVDKDKVEENISDEQKAVLEQFSNEFRQLQNRTWWDSFIDGINRLPRPVLAFAVLGLFVSAAIDPLYFSEVMTALQLVPEWLAIIAGQIILLFYGGRTLENLNFGKTASVDQVKGVISTINQIREMRSKKGTQVQSTERQDGTPTATAIEEWKRRRHGA